jgi:hypothetical protein
MGNVAQLNRGSFFAYALMSIMLSVALAAKSEVGSGVKWITNLATVLTTVGKQWIVDKLDESVATKAQFVAWGTGAGTAAVGDTTLFTEAAEARISGTESQPSADIYRVVGTITSASAQTITNAGTFTASTSGTLVVKGDFTGIVLAIGDSIQFTINLQVT